MMKNYVLTLCFILGVFTIAWTQEHDHEHDTEIKFKISGLKMVFHDTMFFQMDETQDLLYSPLMPMVIKPIGEVPMDENRLKQFEQDPESYLRTIKDIEFDSVKISVDSGFIYFIGHEECSAEEIEELGAKNYCDLITVLFFKKIEEKWISCYVTYPSMIKEEYHDLVLYYLKTLTND